MLDRWTQIISNNHLPMRSQPELITAALPAFRPEIFQEYFGTPYLQLSRQQLALVYEALQSCFHEPWRSQGLAYAFGSGRGAIIGGPLLGWVEAIQKIAKSGDMSIAGREQRTVGTSVIFESADVLAYGKQCSPLTTTIIEVVYKKNADYLIAPDNSAFRSLYENALDPAIRNYCRDARSILTVNYLAGVHINDVTLNESAVQIPNERPVNSLYVRREAQGYRFDFGDPDTRSLSEVRAGREKMVSAAESRRAGVRAAETESLAKEGIAAGERSSTLTAFEHESRRSSPAKRWYWDLLNAKSISRSELLKGIKSVRITLPAKTDYDLSPAEQKRLVSQAIASLGLKEDPAAAAVLTIDVFGGEGSYVASVESSLGSKESPVYVTWVWAKAALTLPAIVRREGRFYRTMATVASAIAARMKVGSKPTAAQMAAAVSNAIANLPDDAALGTAAFLADNQWIDILLAQQSHVDSLYRFYKDTVDLSNDGSKPLVLGIRNVASIDAKISPLNRDSGLVFVAGVSEAMQPMSSLLGLRTTWDPKPVWQEALAAVGVALNRGGPEPELLPRLSHLVSGMATKVAEINGKEIFINGIMGQAGIIEPACLTKGDSGLLRSTCTVANYLSFAAGPNRGGDNFLGPLDKQTAKAALAIEEQFRQR